MLPSIREAVDRAIPNRVNRLHVKQDHVVQELLRIALADPADAFDENGALLALGEMPEDIQRAISGMDVEEIFAGRGEDRIKIGEVRKLKFWSKPQALELLSKHIGMIRKQRHVLEAPTAARRRCGLSETFRYTYTLTFIGRSFASWR